MGALMEGIKNALIWLAWIFIVLTIIASAIYGDKIIPDRSKQSESLREDQRDTFSAIRHDASLELWEPLPPVL